MTTAATASPDAGCHHATPSLFGVAAETSGARLSFVMRLVWSSSRSLVVKLGALPDLRNSIAARCTAYSAASSGSASILARRSTEDAALSWSFASATMRSRSWSFINQSPVLPVGCSEGGRRFPSISASCLRARKSLLLTVPTGISRISLACSRDIP